MNRDTLLFDLDGTLTDTDDLHYEAFQRLLAPLGRSLSMDDFKHRIVGVANSAVMAWLLPEVDPSRHVAIADEKEAMFRALVAEDHARLAPTPGLPALIDWAERRGVRMAVVTNAQRANADLMLGALGLDKRLTELVIAEELARGKPDPLPYQTALRRLGSSAAQALAFEDSRSGVRAASAAGIETIGLLTSLDEPALRQAGAAHVLRDFTAPWFLEKLEREFATAN